MAELKTTLVQQRDIVDVIQKTTRIQGIKLLREWLGDNGYEPAYSPCPHTLIYRESGSCAGCGRKTP